MSDEETTISEEHEHLLELLYDGNSYYLNMGTINTYDPFYPLYHLDYVWPAPNGSTWYLSGKGYAKMEDILTKRKNNMSEQEQSVLFAFEQGIKYQKRSSQHKATKWEYLSQSLSEAENETS